MNSQPTFLFLTYLNLIMVISKAYKPDNFKLHNLQKLSFTNIPGLRSNFVDCESFLGSNSHDILALCEANLDDPIDSGNFSVRANLPLIQNDSSTHMHGLAVYVKEGLPFTRHVSIKMCRFLLMLLTGFTTFSVLLLILLSITFFVFVHGFLFCFILHR